MNRTRPQNLDLIYEALANSEDVGGEASRNGANKVHTIKTGIKIPNSSGGLMNCNERKINLYKIISCSQQLKSLNIYMLNTVAWTRREERHSAIWWFNWCFHAELLTVTQHSVTDPETSWFCGSDNINNKSTLTTNRYKEACWWNLSDLAFLPRRFLVLLLVLLRFLRKHGLRLRPAGIHKSKQRFNDFGAEQWAVN